MKEKEEQLSYFNSKINDGETSTAAWTFHFPIVKACLYLGQEKKKVAKIKQHFKLWIYYMSEVQ